VNPSLAHHEQASHIPEPKEARDLPDCRRMVRGAPSLTRCSSSPQRLQRLQAGPTSGARA
jgi:hypothetical protein